MQKYTQRVTPVCQELKQNIGVNSNFQHFNSKTYE